MATVSASSSFRTIQIRSWPEFLGAIMHSEYSNWAYRGQSDATLPLETSLTRYLTKYNVSPEVWRTQEQRILRIFKRKAHNYLEHIPDFSDDLQWLALMEHHGSPTRLLDFTWSPYVAAFFALNNAVAESAVWGLNPQILVHPQWVRTGRRRVRIDPQAVDPRKPGNVERYFLKGQNAFLWLGEPDVMNKRVIAQSGTFAMPSVIDQSITEILSRYENAGHSLVKFVLSGGVREKGLRELYRMNITYATLFPDLDGLSRSLGYELEFHWAFEPHATRSLERGLLPQERKKQQRSSGRSARLGMPERQRGEK
jgi:hypothetical protein